MKKRKFLTITAWSAPIVTAITLPAHAETSAEPAPTTTEAAQTTPQPNPTLPHYFCADGFKMMCKTGETGIYNTVCVHESNIARYESLGYTLGMCQPKQ